MIIKHLRRILSVVLALVLALSLSAATFASANERNCPEICVPGFMSVPIYVNPENEAEGLAWPPPTEKILACVKGSVGPLARLSVTWDWDRFAEELVPLVDGIFESAFADFSGEITNGSGIKFTYPDAQDIKRDSKLDFEYDWRQDPLKTAAELDAFINYVCEASGSDKVTLQCHSMGGVITLSYISLFGYEKLQSVLFNTTAIFGESYTGELFSGNIVLDSEAILNYMKFVFDDNDYELILNALFEVLDKSGIMPLVCKMGNGIIDRIYEKAIISIMHLFVNWSSVWTMVPDEYLEAAMAYVFEDVYPKAGVDFSQLKAKVENYNRLVRSSRVETLRELNENTNMYVISRYGYSALPITPAWNQNSDSNIDAKFSSFGATAALYGEALDINEGRFVSPDKAINAATCLFPEQTWFIKNIGHSVDNDKLQDFFETLLYNETQATIDTFEQYPQFMLYNAEDGSITADTTKPAAQITFFQKIKDFFSDFIKMFKGLFAF